MGFLTEKVKEKPDPNSKTAIDFDSKVTAERDKQIKVSAPNFIIIYPSSSSMLSSSSSSSSSR